MQRVLSFIRGLSPLGPIFGKELRVTSRRKRTYLLRLLYLAVLLLILVFFYLAAREGYEPERNVAARAQRGADMGEVFFGVFIYFTLCAMALVGPILTSTAINSERLHKTLGVLLMTPITGWQIVSGKLFSRLLIALTLLALGLPVLATVRLLGGVEVDQMIGGICLCAATALSTAALGLFLSTLVSRAYAVILISYCLLFVVWIVAPIMILLVGVSLVSGPGGMMFIQKASTVMALVHPFYAMAGVVQPVGVPWFTLGWKWCALSQVLFAALMLLLSSLVLRRISRREHSSGGSIAAAPPMIAPAMPPPLPGSAQPEPFPTPRPRAPARTRQIGGNPILWRELRQHLMNRRWQSIASGILMLGMLLGIYVLLFFARGWRDDRMIWSRYPQSVFAACFCGLMNVFACLVSATAIAHEKESDTWTLVLATPLTAGQIVWGKLAGLLRRLIWPAIVIALHFAVFAAIGIISLETLFVVLWMIFPGNAVWLATGLYWSLRLKTVTYAVVMNMLMVALAYGGVPMVTGIVAALAGGSEETAEVVALYCPYWYAVTGVEELNTSNDTRFGGFIDIPLYGDVRRDTFLVIAFAVGVGHLLVAAGVLGMIMMFFDRMVGRAAESRGPARVVAT